MRGQFFISMIQNQISIDLGIKNQNTKGLDKNNIAEGIWFHYDSIEDAFKETDAIVVLTEWEEYSAINWSDYSTEMRSPAWVFDARSIVDKNDVLNAGLKLWRVGDGS